MRIEVKLFAIAKDLAGRESVGIELPHEARIADLRAALVREHPKLTSVVRHATFAINSEYAGDETKLTADAEVACIPPVSGG